MPPKYNNEDLDENKYRLPTTVKLPSIYTLRTIKPPRVPKELFRQFGEELNQNTFQIKQFGMIALSAGRLKVCNLESIRNTCQRNLTAANSFAFYRVDMPQLPVTTHGLGKKLGGGKGRINSYVTPIKAGQVIFEIGGSVLWEEVQPWLERLARRMPFHAVAVNQEMLNRLNLEENRLHKENSNPYTTEWLMRNNIFDCHQWLSPRDKLWFGKFVYRDREVENNIKFGSVMQLALRRI